MTANPEADAAFWKFFSANPDVYKAFVYFALEAKRKGADRIGAKAVWERLRWSLNVEFRTNGKDYALNNNFVSRYARLAMNREPSLAGMFETRKLKPQPQPVTY